jgi:uncharacterized protein (DUF2147 family)
MKRLLTIAAVLLASSAAHAGDSYSFEVGGRTIHIEAPSDCDSPSCVSVNIPGVYESGPRRGNRARANSPDPQAKAAPAPRTAPAAPIISRPETSRPEQQQPRDQVDRTPPAPAPAPAPTTTAAAPSSEPAPAAAPPAADPSAPSEPKAPAAGPVVAAAPASAPIPREQAPAAAPSRPAGSPLGVWQTEKKEGLVRIEACGANLCGYSVDGRTNANGEKVLINMKPVSDTKWSGRIHDPKSGGNYDSTIALKGSDTLRVQGCAFGGMFCGGQTWSRVN